MRRLQALSGRSQEMHTAQLFVPPRGQKCFRSSPVSLLPSGKTGASDSHILVIVIIISVGAFTIILVVVGAFLCTRRTTSHQKK